MITRRATLYSMAALIPTDLWGKVLPDPSRLDRNDPGVLRLINAMLEIHERFDIPQGIFITPCFQTGNLLVHNLDLGFAITAMAIRDRLHITSFQPSLDRLLESTKQFVSIPS